MRDDYRFMLKIFVSINFLWGVIIIIIEINFNEYVRHLMIKLHGSPNWRRGPMFLEAVSRAPVGGVTCASRRGHVTLPTCAIHNHLFSFNSCFIHWYSKYRIWLFKSSESRIMWSWNDNCHLNGGYGLMPGCFSSNICIYFCSRYREPEELFCIFLPVLNMPDAMTMFALREKLVFNERLFLKNHVFPSAGSWDVHVPGLFYNQLL